ncbi:MAG: response regulator [Burkholderiales bacterium]|nr:response regulator [Burkholderiales bacterium]
MAGAVAALVGALYLHLTTLREPAIWGIVGATAMLAAALVLLRAERRKRAASVAMLVEAKERLAYAVENASLAVWDWDIRSGQVRFNGLWSTMLGGEPRDSTMTAAQARALVHPADLGDLRARIRSLLRNKSESYDLEHRLRTQGEYLWVRNRGKVVQRGADGGVVRIIGVVTDISKTVAAAESLRKSRGLMLSQQADVLQFLQEAVRQWGDISVVLPQVTELTAKALRAERVSLWHYDESGSKIVCADQYENSTDQHQSGMERDPSDLPTGMKALDPRSGATDDSWSLAKDRNQFFVDDVVAFAPAAMYLPILRSAKQIGVFEIERSDRVSARAEGWTSEERLFGIMISSLVMLLMEQDAHRRIIADLKRAQREIKDALTRAEEAARARDDFLATVSHELRTPLNAIIGFNTLMLEKACSPQESARYLGFARDAGKALLLQVNDLLDMAKIEAGNIELESIGFDLRELIERSVDMVRGDARNRGLEVQTSISAEVARWVRGDPARLRQVLLNLLSNAVKFTARGSIFIGAALRADGKLEIKVADTGTGIPPDRLGKIFEKFFQSDVSITRQYGGTGLGLAISRSLVNLMRGTLSVESMPGSGSTFFVVLPFDPVAAPALPAAAVRKARAGRVLVVEDQAANAILAKALVEHLGHEVESAENGLEAIDKLTRQSFDLVLMDLAMPVMGGLEATRRIRNLANPMKDVVIVAVSASAYAADIERCKAAGMNDHLAKPIELEALTQILDRWLAPIGEMPAKERRSAEAASGDPHIDKLVAAIGLRAVRNVAAAFRSVLPQRLALFRASALEKPAIKVEAHNLAGIAATLGFAQLAEIASEVEHRCETRDPIGELMPELIARCEFAERSLQSLLPGDGRS